MKFPERLLLWPLPLLLLTSIARPCESVVTPKRTPETPGSLNQHSETSTVQQDGAILFDPDAPSCRTPQGYTGKCVPITKCPRLYEALLELSNFETEEFLLRSHCGRLRDGVCCGHAARLPSITDTDKEAVGFSTLRPKETSTRQPAPTFRVPPTHRVPPTTERTTTTISYNAVKPIVSKFGKCGRRQRQVGEVRVVGGEPSRLGEWPWMVALGYRKRRPHQREPLFGCGASLISDRYILTAGHCAAKDRPYLARLGDLNLISTSDGASPVEVPVDNVIVHPKFNAVSLTNDIAIVTLRESVTFSKDIQPICLPMIQELQSNDFAGSTQTVAGWGSTYFEGPTSPAMQHVLLPVLSNDDCVKSYSRVKGVNINPDNICAGYTNNKKHSTCQGDSGGPLMIRVNGSFYLTGIVSYGVRCADSPYPAVFTRVTNYVDWILEVVK